MNLFNIDKSKLTKEYLDVYYRKKNHCDSAANTFIPFINLFQGEMFEANDKRIYEYSYCYPTPPTSTHQRRNDYSRLIDQLKNSITFWNFSFDSISYAVAMGIIIRFFDNDPRLLLTLAIKSTYIYSINKNLLEMNNFILLIDRSFTEMEEYKKVYKKINTEYIKEAASLGIATLITEDIESWCYNPAPIKSLKFATITEMKQFLLQFNNLAYGQQLQLG